MAGNVIPEKLRHQPGIGIIGSAGLAADDEPDLPAGVEERIVQKVQT